MDWLMFALTAVQRNHVHEIYLVSSKDAAVIYLSPKF
jgi:hypothetical protein